MTKPRKQQIDLDYCQIYHCITRCVRQLRLLTKERVAWIRERLVTLSAIYAIDTVSFALLYNHLHLVLWVDPERARRWCPHEVVRRWYTLHPPYIKGKKMTELDPEWLAEQAKDPKLVAELRGRLMDISWFMKDLKQPLATQANREDGKTGAFFEGRFKSIALLDELALLIVMGYVDRNRYAAGLDRDPILGMFTSISERVRHVEQLERRKDLEAAQKGSFAASRAAAGLEENLWLAPIEDRRRIDSERPGLLEGYTLAQYVILVDTTAKVLKKGKRTLPPDTPDIFTRLGISAQEWLETQATLSPRNDGKFYGTFFATTREKLREAAQHFGRRCCRNLNGYMAS